MDIFNDSNNDDISMADSNNNSDSDNDRDATAAAAADNNIDHARLKELSNYAHSELPQHLLAEIRKGETKMVSFINPQRYEGTGISLDWGEYYVHHNETDDDDDEKESSLSSYEEAEEINDQELEKEEQAKSLAVNIDTSREPTAMNYDQLDTKVDSSNPTLMGMPDIILERILHYTARNPSEVCVLERVCKRIRRLTTSEEFWLRHPLSTKGRSSILGKTPKLPDNCVESRLHLYIHLKKCKWRIENLPFTRELAFELEAVGRIRYSQCNESNAILDELKDEDDCVASTFRTLSADILSRMNQLGPDAHFRLRGDTIGYICELLQGYIVDRLEVVVLLAISRNRESVAVQRGDIALAFRRQSDIFSFPSSFSSQAPMRWGVHGPVESLLDCSLSLPSSSSIVWRWPGDDCHDVLPPEAGRSIIRRLGYIAGIVKMSNEAFILAEAELLHALGVLLVTAYESSVDMANKAQILGAEDALTYDAPPSTVDMFNTPPPLFQNQQLVYTIVPGQIRTAAEQRGITPYKVYGAEWVVSSEFTEEEEMDIEQSYYYEESENESILNNDSDYDEDEIEAEDYNMEDMDLDFDES